MCLQNLNNSVAMKVWKNKLIRSNFCEINVDIVMALEKKINTLKNESKNNST